jgi:hypothetical protein
VGAKKLENNIQENSITTAATQNTYRSKIIKKLDITRAATFYLANIISEKVSNGVL